MHVKTLFFKIKFEKSLHFLNNPTRFMLNKKNEQIFFQSFSVYLLSFGMYVSESSRKKIANNFAHFFNMTLKFVK